MMKICACRCSHLLSFARIFIVSDLLKIECEASCASGSIVAVIETQIQFLQIEAINSKFLQNFIIFITAPGQCPWLFSLK